MRFVILIVGAALMVGCASEFSGRVRTIWAPEDQKYEYTQKPSGETTTKAEGMKALDRKEILLQTPVPGRPDASQIEIGGPKRDAKGRFTK